MKKILMLVITILLMVNFCPLAYAGFVEETTAVTVTLPQNMNDIVSFDFGPGGGSGYINFGDGKVINLGDDKFSFEQGGTTKASYNGGGGGPPIQLSTSMTGIFTLSTPGGTVIADGSESVFEYAFTVKTILNFVNNQAEFTTYGDVTPEPSTIISFLAGLAAFAVKTLRRRK